MLHESRNLTVNVDAQILKKSRIRALEEETSVSAVINDFLTTYSGVGLSDQQETIRRFLKEAEGSRSGSGAGGRNWSRDEIYDRH